MSSSWASSEVYKGQLLNDAAIVDGRIWVNVSTIFDYAVPNPAIATYHNACPYQGILSTRVDDWIILDLWIFAYHYWALVSVEISTPPYRNLFLGN